MKRGFPTRQRGVAVVTALLLTTLAVSIVASLFWQQQVQVRSIENQRLHSQTRWIVRAGLDLVRLVLRQDLMTNGRITRADDIWATPLAETRLDEFVKRERIEGESFDATIAGQTYDAQSRYNLANLASMTGNGGIDTKQLQVFQRLLQNLQLNPSLAKVVATQVARSQGAGQLQGGPPQPDVQLVAAGSGQPMKMLRVEDLLSVSGFDQRAIEKLRDLVVVLPEHTAVNVNTASAELLAAMVAGMSVSEGQNLVLARKRTPWDAQQFKQYLQGMGKSPILKDGDYEGVSYYFLVLSRVRYDRAELLSWSLVHRQQTGTRVVWIREI